MDIYDNDEDDDDSDRGIEVDDEEETEEAMADVKGDGSSTGTWPYETTAYDLQVFFYASSHFFSLHLPLLCSGLIKFKKINQ